MDVRSIDWQVYLFRERLNRMLLQLARSMAAPQAEAQFTAWNDNQDLVVCIARCALRGCVHRPRRCRLFTVDVVFARASAELLLLEQLIERTHSIQESSMRLLFARITSLFALWTMEQNLRWFIATDLLIAADLKAIEVRLVLSCVSFQ